MLKLFFVPLLSFSIYATGPEWIKKSNEVAMEFTSELGKIYPERASVYGHSMYDSKALKLNNAFEKKELDFFNKWIQKLNAIDDRDIEVDIKILKNFISSSLEEIRLKNEVGEITFYDGSRFVFNHLQELINPQSPINRKKSAVDRFKSYVHANSLIKSFENIIKFNESRYANKNKLYPLKTEIELYLSESKTYLSGIKEMLSQSGRNDWENDFNIFANQIHHYDQFIKNELLPKARIDYKLPRQYYQFKLNINGITATPEELIKIGRTDYKIIFKEFSDLARKIAELHHLTENSPAAVIKYFKSHRIKSGAEAELIYREADKNLERMIIENKLVTLPKSPLFIRVAGEAESNSLPIPHLNPPPLVDNHGERPEFVVPSSSSGDLPFDDFSYPEAAYILTAHEGRPGHDLQFSSMLDNGISLIRSQFAENSVNEEGWALYAEDLMFPFLPLEAKLVALQSRLWRVARTFLDPEIQLGLSTKEDVIRIFTKELGVSDFMANQEFNRYSYSMIGQAPSYYFGLLKIKAAKVLIKNKLKDEFDERCFNDGVLSLGLLPLDFIKNELLEKLNCR